MVRFSRFRRRRFPRRRSRRGNFGRRRKPTFRRVFTAIRNVRRKLMAQIEIKRVFQSVATTNITSGSEQYQYIPAIAQGTALSDRIGVEITSVGVESDILVGMTAAGYAWLSFILVRVNDSTGTTTPPTLAQLYQGTSYPLYFGRRFWSPEQAGRFTILKRKDVRISTVTGPEIRHIKMYKRCGFKIGYIGTGATAASSNYNSVWLIITNHLSNATANYQLLTTLTYRDA